MRKQYISYIVIAILSLTNILNINNVSALSYESNVGVGFTFNPTLSVSLSSSDLVISNLTPGSSADSNSINVSVATNAAYGYTLSAIMNGDNNDLTHTNGTNTFSSIATNADLSDLDNSEDTNIWGYSHKDNTAVSPTWSNYNGLSSSVSKTLLDTNTNNTETGIDSIDFKIAAKAGNTQPSGEYTGTINFIAVSKVAPMSLLDSFIASDAEQLNGYYKMQDMTHDICKSVDIEESELQLIDVRDNKIYWVAKLKDGNCWMTQNLDLDLDSNKTYTHYDTDLGWSNPDNLDTSAAWRPDNSTIDFTIGSTISNWVVSSINPYSANPGDVYFYTSNSDANDIQYNSLQECINANHNDCAHYHAGNYYNWSAAVASNDTTEMSGYLKQANDSICPSGWKMTGNGQNNDINNLLASYNIKSTTGSSYLENGFNSVRVSPLYFIRSGYIYSGSLSAQKKNSYYYSKIIYNNSRAFYLYFGTSTISSAQNNLGRNFGFSVRCLAR